MKIEVYADGSATTSDKPGGYGWVITIDGEKHDEGCGYIEKATNNDAELEAAIAGLSKLVKYLKSDLFLMRTESLRRSDIDIYLVSDSQIILNWANGTYRFKQVDKLDKYDTLIRLMNMLQAKTRWVKGHSGDEHNERCDQLANAGRLRVDITQVSTAKKAKKAAESSIGTRTEGVFTLSYNGNKKLVDFVNNLCEDYKDDIHGEREVSLELRGDK